MTEPKPSASSDDVFVAIDDLGRTEYHHRDCGKVWYEKQGVESPNYCPNCGEGLFDNTEGDDND